jgi:hypothetical protein
MEKIMSPEYIETLRIKLKGMNLAHVARESGLSYSWLTKFILTKPGHSIIGRPDSGFRTTTLWKLDQFFQTADQEASFRRKPKTPRTDGDNGEVGETKERT